MTILQQAPSRHDDALGRGITSFCPTTKCCVGFTSSPSRIPEIAFGARAQHAKVHLASLGCRIPTAVSRFDQGLEPLATLNGYFEVFVLVQTEPFPSLYEFCTG